MNEPREKETTGTREKILLSAEKLIGKKGYAQVSMRDIAEDACVSLGQITYHFNSKDALFIEVVRSLTSSFLKDFNKTPKGKRSGPENAAEILRQSKNALLKSPDKRKMLMDFSNMALWSGEYAAEFNSLFSKMERAIKEDSPSADGADCSEIVKIASSITIGASMFHLITGDREILGIFDKVADAFEKNFEK